MVGVGVGMAAHRRGVHTALRLERMPKPKADHGSGTGGRIVAVAVAMLVAQIVNVGPLVRS